MKSKKTTDYSIVAVMFCLLAGCADAERERKVILENRKNASIGDQISSKSPADARNQKNALVEFVRERKLADYQSVNIGKAFDDYRYFESKQWSDSRSTNKNIYIDFIGWNKGGERKEGVVAVGYDVKFVIKSDGTWFVAMVSRLEKSADGTIVSIPLEDMKGVLDSIYGNRPINSK